MTVGEAVRPSQAKMIPPSRPVLANRDVHLWLASLEPGDAALERLAAWLSTVERLRAGRFRFPRDRRRYVAAHGLLRLLLSRYLSVGAGELRFAEGATGKPGLAGAGSGNLRFNLAHSGGLALFAVTRGHEVGVDLERTKRGFDWADLAPKYFSSPERAALAALPHDRRSRVGYEIWTRKEAWVKAIATGLTIALEDFDVCTSDEPAWIGRSDRPAEADRRWTLRSVEAGDGFSAAVAVEGRDAVIGPVARFELNRD